MYSYPLHTSICQSLIDVLLYTHSPKEAEEKRATDYSSVAKIQLQMTIAPFSFVSQEIWGQQLLWTTQYTNISITASFRYQALNQKCQKCWVINSRIQSGLKVNNKAKLEPKYYKKLQNLFIGSFQTYIRPFRPKLDHFRPTLDNFRPTLDHFVPRLDLDQYYIRPFLDINQSILDINQTILNINQTYNRPV